jgi:hypothetical protein
MMARNHEISGFAVTTLTATAVGMPPLTALALGVLGLYAADWPDIDHEKATITRSLSWIPYWFHFPWDEKTQDHKRRKDGHKVIQVRKFPGYPLHRCMCALSGWIWDRCATELDRKDRNRMWGPAFRVHRGFTHSVWFALLVGAAWFIPLALIGLGAPSPLFGGYSAAAAVAGALAAGCIAHIAGDACTDFGIAGAGFAPLLKVDGRRYWHSGLWEPIRFKVNKTIEKTLIGPVCGALALYSVAGAFFGPTQVLNGLYFFALDVWTRLA